MNKEITRLELVEGGTTIKQGHYFTLALTPRDATGKVVNLTGKNIAVAIVGKRGVIHETTGQYDASKEVIRFSVNENIGYGEVWMEITVTDPNDPDYRQKFPTSEYDGKLTIIRSTDDIGYVGVQMVTVEQLRKEQQDAQTAYEKTIDQKVQSVDQATTKANNATSNADAAAGKANTAADSANQAARFAETEGQKASEAASEAQLAKEETVIATQEALDAAELARNYVDDEGAIYGVFWPKTADPVLTRTNSAQGKIANVGVDGEYVQNDFDDAQIYREIGRVTDEYGNEFIRIPKFYIRKTDGPGFKSIQVSKTQHGGFYLPKCFWDFTNSVELSYIDIGKYRASLSSDNKLESKPDLYPLVSRNIVQFREYARNNNINGLNGYQQEDIHVRDIISTLFYVEFATLHSQSVMYGFGTGEYSEAHVAVLTEAQANRVVLANAHAAGFRVGQSIGIGTYRGGNNITDYRTVMAINAVDADNQELVFDGAPLDIVAGHFIYNTAYKTGFSRNVAASSGSPVSNTDGKHPCSYRGIESPWGDIYTFIDGINISDHQAWVAENADDYASNVFAHPYEKLGYINSVDSGYPKYMGYDANHPYAELPVEVGANTVTYYSDYYYQATGERVALVGGSWSDGSSAGLSYWYAANSSGNAHLFIGGRLVRKTL